MWDKQTVKSAIVIVSLLVLAGFLFSIGRPWWSGLIFVIALLGIELPIGALLQWWIKK